MDAEGFILDATPADGDFLERLGHPVLVCHGPEMSHLYPILKDGCEMVNTAHGVLFRLGLERPQLVAGFQGQSWSSAVSTAL
ncbi:MAG: hypothetical protein GY926_11715 [bacterium]|nr:hypothetical protein [bacterium]